MTARCNSSDRVLETQHLPSKLPTGLELISQSMKKPVGKLCRDLSKDNLSLTELSINGKLLTLLAPITTKSRTCQKINLSLSNSKLEPAEAASSQIITTLKAYLFCKSTATSNRPCINFSLNVIQLTISFFSRSSLIIATMVQITQMRRNYSSS